MAQTIKIKRSSTTTAPSSLASGELAYSTKTGVQKLYYGDGTDVLAIGGKSYTDKLDGIESGANVTDATNVAAAGALMTTGGSLTSHLSFGDNVQAKFGASSDLKIFHDDTTGSEASHIEENGNGNLIIKGSNIEVRSSTDELYAQFVQDGVVQLSCDNVVKLSTTADGINVIGEVKGDSLDIDGDADISGDLNFGVSDKAIFNTNFEIYRDASNAIISETGAGSLILRGTNLSLQSDDNDQYIQCVENGGVTIYHQDSGNSSPKLVTKADGVDVTGELQSDSLDVDGNADISGTLTVGGDLNITGNVNSHNVTDLDVTDKTITVGAGQASAASANSGLVVGGSDARFLYSGTKFEIDQGSGTLSAVLTASNFGSEYTGSLDGGTF